MCNGVQNIMAKMIGYDGKYTVNSSTSVHTITTRDVLYNFYNTNVKV